MRTLLRNVGIIYLRHRNPEEQHPHFHCCENLRSH